jgi:2-dehydro-3-deoxygluconokinase
LNVKDFDLDRIFGREGVQIMHLSGLIGALSPDTSHFCLELARAAKKHGTRISFDLNHRARSGRAASRSCTRSLRRSPAFPIFWSATRRISSCVLNVEGPEAGGVDLAAKIDNFKAMINRAKQSFPNARSSPQRCAR